MSNKNRKRNLRKIIVNDEIYFWNVSNYNCDGDGGHKFDIWKDKKKIYDGLIHKKIIRPKDVSEKILELIKQNDTKQ